MERDIRRARLEELYAGVHKYMIEVRSIGDHGYSQDRKNLDRIGLLIHLYFPQLLPIFNRVETTAVDCAIQAVEPGPPTREFYRLYEESDELMSAVLIVA